MKLAMATAAASLRAVTTNGAVEPWQKCLALAANGAGAKTSPEAGTAPSGRPLLLSGGGCMAPVMMATASDIEYCFGSITAMRRPRRWMWMRSATSKTCGMLWLMRMIGRPRFFTSSISSSTRRDSLTPSAAVGSSMMMTRLPKAVARTTATP